MLKAFQKRSSYRGLGNNFVLQSSAHSPKVTTLKILHRVAGVMVVVFVIFMAVLCKSMDKKKKTKREELSEKRIQEEYEKLGAIT